MPRNSGTAKSPQRLTESGYADRRYCREHGSRAWRQTATGSGLDTNADFDGTFSGAFYGAKGKEVGGVFDFASDDGDNEGGAFRGAFGGQK